MRRVWVMLDNAMCRWMFGCYLGMVLGAVGHGQVGEGNGDVDDEVAGEEVSPREYAQQWGPHSDRWGLGNDYHLDRVRGSFTRTFHVLADEGFFTWGGSVVRGEDGRYHAFYSRWPHEVGFTAWMTHSEVARAVSDSPAGPWEHVGVVLQGRGGDGWDAVMAHNPKIYRFEGRYYLYFVATSAAQELTQEQLVEASRNGRGRSEFRRQLRNRQRVGVAVADSLEGPWVRMEEPLLEPSGPIENVAVNPALAYDAGRDRYVLVVKGDDAGPQRDDFSQAVAVAEGPTGPFVMQPQAMIDYRRTEDVSLWRDGDDGRFYGIFHTGDSISVLSSADGVNWPRESLEVLVEKRMFLELDLVAGAERVERPGVVYDQTILPSALHVAVKGQDTSAVVFVRLYERCLSYEGLRRRRAARQDAGDAGDAGE